MIDETQVYVVVDIEADGPVPGLYSMLSIGAVATTGDEELASFYEKIEPLDGASQDPRVMAWWEKHPQAWQEATANPRPAEVVMRQFVDWLDNLGKAPLFVAQPVAFDYTFVYWYLIRFVGRNPFVDEADAPTALDLPSFISGKHSINYNKAKRTALPEWTKEGMPEHSHNALEDARGIAVILRNVLSKS